MPAEEKAQYEKKAADAKAQYEKDLAAFKEGGGVAGQRRQDKKVAKQAKADKAAKKEANADKPKRPAGGAFGVFVSKNRAEITKSLPPGHTCTAVTLKASEMWKALSAEDRKPYDAEYQEKKTVYETELKVWKEAKGISADAEDEEQDEENEDGETSPQKEDAKKTSPKKRAAKEKPESPPAKKAKGEGKAKKKEAASPQGPEIPAAIIEEAKKSKLDGALTNLASRPDVVEKNISADKLLAALQKSGGLVNKAKAALLGA